MLYLKNKTDKKYFTLTYFFPYLRSYISNRYDTYLRIKKKIYLFMCHSEMTNECEDSNYELTRISDRLSHATEKAATSHTHARLKKTFVFLLHIVKCRRYFI